MKKFLPEISLLLTVALLNLITGCGAYYRVHSAPPLAAQSAVMSPWKYIILHQGDNAWHLTDIKIDSTGQFLSGSTQPLPLNHIYYYSVKERGANRYKPNQGNPTEEVHIYTSEYAKTGDGSVTVPMDAIQKVQLYEPDKAATIASYTFGTIGVLMGVFVLVGVIILLTKSSCPIVYANQGADRKMMGEMFGGAINSSSERDDYMPLPGLKSYNGEYSLEIANELLEKQYVNQAELILANHPAGTSVLIDRNGELQQFSSLQPPQRAVSGNGFDCTAALSSSDSLVYLFNQGDPASSETSSLLMEFDKPAGAENAKLVMHLKNSFWLDYIYGKFNELFGTYFDEFNQKQQKASPETNLQWSLSQGIPLKVYLQTAEGWQMIDYVNTVGPLASRNVVVPAEVADIEGSKVNIRLECGFAFWEIDYAGIDYSNLPPPAFKAFKAASATDERGRDLKTALARTDNKYLYQPEVGNKTTLSFQAIPGAPGMEQTAFFHSRGYYEYIRHYTGKPDRAYLRTFRQPGAFARFSKQHYDTFVNDKDFIINALTVNHAK